MAKIPPQVPALAARDTTSSTVVHETERKYEAGATTEPPSLEGLPEVDRVSEPETYELDATYYDTADSRLLAAGITLRRRTGGGDEGWHLKVPTGQADSRRERQVPLGPVDEDVPEELSSLVRVRSREHPLGPVAELRTVRRRLLLLDRRGIVLAEVAVDTVTARTLDSPAAAGGQPVETLTWREIEAELISGGVDLLDALEARLAEHGIVRSRQSSKVGRLLAGRLTRRPSYDGVKSDADELGKKSKVGPVVWTYLAEQVDTLIDYDPRVRLDEPDSVHQLRVASRRIRSVLKSYRSVVGRDRAARLDGELKWLTGEMGVARDDEVQRDQLLERVTGLGDEWVVGPVAARLGRHFAGTGVEARKVALAALGQPRYFALLDDLEALIAGGPVAHAGRKARKDLPRRLRKAHDRLVRSVEAVPGLAGEERVAAIHDVRKKAKRARYAGEVAAPVLGSDATRFVKAMKKLQQRLGESQDAAVSCEKVSQLADEARRAGEETFTYGVLVGQDLALRAEVDRNLPVFWDKYERATKYR